MNGMRKVGNKVSQSSARKAEESKEQEELDFEQEIDDVVAEEDKLGDVKLIENINSGEALVDSTHISNLINPPVTSQVALNSLLNSQFNTHIGVVNYLLIILIFFLIRSILTMTTIIFELLNLKEFIK